MFRYYIQVLGCAMRGVEAQRVNQYLKINGGIETNLEESDIIVFFSCSIISNTEEHTIENLKRFEPLNKRIILLGCSPGISQKRIAEVFDGEMLATKDLEDIDRFFPEFEKKFSEIPLPGEYHFNFPYGEIYISDFLKFRTWGNRIRNMQPRLIVTSKGCNNACRYCSVRKALGQLKSYPWSNIITQYETSLKQGYKVFVFNGDDTGAFVTNDGRNFGDLLYELHAICPKKNIRWIIDNFHPQWFIKYINIIKTLAIKKRIVEIILPLQSASDTILESMRRKHTLADVLSQIQDLKLCAPGLSIRTHFIIGYPGETAEDITNIKQLVASKYFSHIVLLRYYETGSPSSQSLTPKIPADVVEERIMELKAFIENLDIKCELTG